MKIKFITLNIEHGGKLFDNIVDFFTQENPDIIVTQEIFNSDNPQYDRRFRGFAQLGKALEKELPHHAFQSAFFDITEMKDGVERGNAVFSRFPLIKNERIQVGKPYAIVDETGMNTYFDVPKILQHVEVELGNERALNIFNLHGYWGTDGKDNPERLKMAEDIKKAMKGNAPMVLAGDTNFTLEAHETIQIIESGGVTSVFGESLATTFNMGHKDPNSGYATAAVDMVFASPDMKVIERKMPEVDVSDHYPLVVEFEV